MRVRVLCLTILPVLLALIAGGIWYYLNLRNLQDLRDQVEAELATLRSEGYPISFNELDAWYPTVPDEENAATIYLEAFEKYVELDENQADVVWRPVDLRGQPVPPDMKKAVEAWLAKNAECLDLLAQGSERKRSRYPVRFNADLFTMLYTPVDVNKGAIGYKHLGHLAAIKSCANLLSFQALLYAERRDEDGAVSALLDMFAIARSLDREPVLLSQLVRIAVMGIGLNTLERVLSRMPLSSANQRQLDDVMVRAFDPKPMQRGILGNLCYCRPSIEEKCPEKTLEQNRLSYLKMARSFLILSEEKTTFPPFLQWKKDMEGLYERGHFIRDEVSVNHVSQVSFFRQIARLRAARTALAIERYRAAKGKIPAKLEDLVPDYLSAVPVDPFDEAPTRYRILKKGYVVYSVSDDCNDNKGGEDGHEWDQAFKVER
jgi:hypothetical protein